MKNNNLVTKQDLEQALGKVEKRFIGEVKQTKEEFLQEVKDFKNETFNRLDAVMGELQTLREEQTIHFGRHEEIEEKLKNLESTKAT